MANKKISQFNVDTNPTLLDVLPIVNNGETKKIALGDLATYIQNNVRPNRVVSDATIFWRNSNDLVLQSNETIVISGDYVLYNSDLTLTNSGIQINVGSLAFNQYSQIFIGGNLLVVDSNIINDGMISVGGGIILSGNSTITGTGIII